MTSETRQQGPRGSIYLGLAAGLFAASGGLLGGYFFLRGDAVTQARAAELRSEAGSGAAEPPAAPEPVVSEAMVQAAAEYLGEPVEVAIGATRLTMRWSDLGVVADNVALSAIPAGGDDPLAAARSAGGMPIGLDRGKAVLALMALKSHHDRGAIDAHLDLEKRLIQPDQPGFAIDVYASLGRIEAAARSAAPTVELAGVPLEARVPSLGIEDISHVMGTFTTKFAVSDKERNFNLKLAASKLNGFVLQPGVEFSFNDVVGDRTEKEGYKVAHVITAGEMVDGLAGGTCQISTTLHGASFFAGIEIVKSTPHSRPSVYAPIGMDATVVYPTTDLKMKNPYDFPVVIHYVVARGEAKVEILGKQRPYDKIEFETEVEEETPFETVTREDDTMPVGSSITDQAGFNGYKLKRWRHYYKGKKEVKKDTWNLLYKPVTEYVRIGTNPDPNLPFPVQPKLGDIKKPGKNGTHLKQ